MIAHPSFLGAPELGKLARAGEWERAVVFRPGELLDESMVLPLVAGSDDVACEAFFKSAFFGVRRTGRPEDLARFVGSFAQVLASAGSGADFFGGVTRELGVPLAQRFRYAELGAEGAWRSVGPFRIDDPAAALTNLDEVWRELQSAPVGRDTVHDKALEFSYDNGDGTTHGVGLPVSDDGIIVRSALKVALRGFADASAR